MHHPRYGKKISKLSLKTRMVPQILGGQAWWPSTIQQLISMQPFSQVTILQVKTIALFPRTLTYALYHSSNSTQWWVPTHWYTSHLSFFFQVKTHTVCSRQTITSLHILINVMRYTMATFINLSLFTFITLSIHFCDGTRNISYAGVHHEIHMYKVVIGPAGSI